MASLLDKIKQNSKLGVNQPNEIVAPKPIHSRDALFGTGLNKRTVDKAGREQEKLQEKAFAYLPALKN